MRTARRAVGLALEAGSYAVEARARETQAMSAATSGKEWDESNFLASLELHRALGDIKGMGLTYNRFGVSAYYAGRWREATNYFALSEELNRRVGREEDAVLNGANRAELLIEQGEYAEAEPLVLAAARVWRASGARSFLAFALMLRGRIRLGERRFDEAVEQLEEARRLCSDLGESDSMVHCDALIAEAEYSSGNSVAALRHAYDALLAADKLGDEIAAIPLLHRIKGYALCSLGDKAEGVAALNRALEIARKRRAEHDIVRALRALVLWDPSDDQRRSEWEAEIAQINLRLGLAF